MNGWKYYNHALLPECAPHEKANVEALKDIKTWTESGGKPIFARYTTEFDCRRETNWWYVIKDTPFDINEIKAKRRYEINKGIKNFSVKVINPLDYIEELYRVQNAAYATWPEKYRPSISKEAFKAMVKQWDSFEVFGAFSREDEHLCGFAYLTKYDSYCDFNVLRVDPDYESLGINAAIVYAILKLYESFILEGGYICDGSRNVNHETAFQNYLEKYFLFRKAYGVLNIRYLPPFNLLISILFLFRDELIKYDEYSIVHKINALLKMESIARGKLDE